MTILFVNRIASWMKQLRPGNGISDNPDAIANLLVDMLIAQVTDRRKGSGLIARANRFRKSTWIIRESELPRLYLLFEQYLVEVDSGTEITRSELRQNVIDDYGELLKIPAFGVIFEPLSKQRKLLCKFMLGEILSGVRASFVHGLSGLIDEIRGWLKENDFESYERSPSILLKYNSAENLTAEERLRFMSMALFQVFASKLGEDQAKRIYTQAYEQTALTFRDLDSFPVVIDMLPEIMLDDDKIALLSRKQIQSVLHAKIDNLQRVNSALSSEISKRNKITRQLRESQHFLEALVNSSMDAVVAMNAKGEITEWNNQAESFFGWQKEEIVGQVISATILPEQDRKGHVKWFENYLSTGQSSFINRRFEFTCIRKDGSLFDAECCIAPMEQDEERYFSVFIRDITSRKEYEKTLRQAKDEAEAAVRAKSEFLAVMSHEIRTPLNGVLGMTQMLKETTLDKEQFKYVNMINTSGNNLNLIINDILDLSKIEVGKMDLECEPFKLGESLLNNVDLFMPRALEKNLQVRFFIDPKMPEIFIGDSTRVGQIVINLLSNAIKFTEQGFIGVKAEIASRSAHFSTIEISVFDSGIGIAQKSQEDIFSAFSQEDSSTSRRFGGTGLGLTICSKLAALMGGKLWVESEPEKGSTFTLSLHLEHQDDTPESSLAMDKRSTYQVAICAKDGFMKDTIVRYLTSAEVAHAICEDETTLFDGLKEQRFTHVILDDESLRSNELGLNSLSDEVHDTRIIVLDDKSKSNKFQISPELENITILPVPSTPCYFYEALDGGSEQKDKLDAETVLDTSFAEKFPLKILVAEDNMINQALIGSILTKLGYEADLVENGIEACSMCGQELYDLVFMDVQMPEMDGITAAQSIKQTFGEQAPRIIALTANTSIEKDPKRKNEFDDFLSKPFQFRDFLIRLEKTYMVRSGLVDGV